MGGTQVFLVRRESVWWCLLLEWCEQEIYEGGSCISYPRHDDDDIDPFGNIFLLVVVMLD